MRRHLLVLAVLCLGAVGCQFGKSELHEIPAERELLLVSKSFRDDLPQEFKASKTVPKTAEILINERAHFKLLVHYEQLLEEPNFFKTVEVELSAPVKDLTVSAEIGEAINLGDTSHPKMAVPILVDWRAGNWSRAAMWNFHADGTLEAQ